ncbi:hypothetical protein ENSA5_49910 [Enhygromyxa salina]|uniref:IgGFc-binding protein N-terminal domain-containing protein n=1 Tax=Enhygromyxa salina TaxID=215803 RepID=A0A2S9XI07_9BACT|nr:IgGFc-binding protein [Enhygromyxa salina]PRP92360.1 hypothetical protein ENSA5_49910 [Enhygromyxa salina]
MICWDFWLNDRTSTAEDSHGSIPLGACSSSSTRGEHAQFIQAIELTGSIIQSDKPLGLMGGHSGMQVPVGTSYSEQAEQMSPPVRGAAAGQ